MLYRRNCTKALCALIWSVCALAVTAIPASALGVNLSPYQLVNRPVGIAYYPYYNQLLVTANWPGYYSTARLLLTNGAGTTPFGGIDANLIDEVKLYTCPDASGGFTAGDVFIGYGLTGELRVCDAAGYTDLTTAVPDPFALLPEVHRLLKGIAKDTTGVWGNNLLVVSSGINDYGSDPLHGYIYAVNSSGTGTLLLTINHALETACIVPNDPTRYGDLAGALLTGGEHSGVLYIIKPDFTWTTIDLTAATGGKINDIENILVIPANSNFYGVDFGGNRILTAPYTDFATQGLVGDILIVNEGTQPLNLAVPPSLWDLKSVVAGVPNITQIEQLGTAPVQWEQVTFAPVTVGLGWSPGYWKNHDWPVTTLTVGGVVYDQAAGQALLGTPPKGDATYILAFQLVAAKLNVAQGFAPPSQVVAAIADGDALLLANPVGTGVKSSSPIGQQMVSCAGVLAAFNAL